MSTKTFGERIRELREARDLSLREFGAKLGGKTAAFLSDIELGRRYPSPELLADMAKVLKTTVDDLKNYDSRPPVQELKRLTDEDPAYGLAFRRLVEKDISPEELMRFLKNKPERTKEK